jgi:hypothetical protein
MSKGNGTLQPMLEASDEDHSGDGQNALRTPLRRVHAVRSRSRKVQRSKQSREGSKGSHLNLEGHDAITDGAIYGAVIGAIAGFGLWASKGGSVIVWWPVLVVVGAVCGVVAEMVDLAITARQRRQERPVILEPRNSHVNRCTDHR